jgi:Outer membrane protein beta-barrel domain
MTSPITRCVALSTLAMLVAAPAPAQRRGAVELGAFARFTNFDNSLGMSSGMGAGGRAAVFVWSGVAFELDVSRTSSDGPAGSGATYTPVHARLVGGLGSRGRVQALLGGGYVHNAYGGSLDASDGGFSALVGVGYQVTNRVWLRMGVDLDVMFHPSSDSRFTFYNGNWGLHFGVGTRLNEGGSALNP